MRRISVLLAFAAILLTAFVGYTYKLRLDKARKARVAPTPKIGTAYEAISTEWHWWKHDESGKLIVSLYAKSAKATHDPSTFEIHDLALKLYNKAASSYTYVKSDKAFFDERSGVLKSDGPVFIVMNVPSDKDGGNPNEAAKRVRVQTSGVTYETKTGKASSERAASFIFPEGDGRAVGVEYDPNTRALHLKSQIALDWV